ncbi:class C beta-lactamase [Pseudomonas sp. SDO528_S397]
MYENSCFSVRKIAAVALLLVSGSSLAATDLRPIVDAQIKPLMQQQDIAGLSVAVLRDGKAQYFNYGVASRETRQPVSENTLFEVGSVSKTFTATLGAYAQATGKLTLTAPASRYLPALQGGKFDQITLLQLATYSAGGLPLQFPQDADSADKMLGYFQQWAPTYAPGQQRLYSNPSIGLFGHLAAQSLGQPFNTAMEQLLPKLGLSHTYISVPPAQMGLYAQGYDKQGKPVRLEGGALDSEAYGIKTSAQDLAHYVAVNMRPEGLEKPLQQAIATTHTGFYTVGKGTTQGLGWESYAYPLTLDALIEGNSTPMTMTPHPIKWLNPPQAESANRLYNKTGGTGGFGTYVAFVPGKNIGVVIVANKNYPIIDRVKVAHAILSAVDH